MSYFIIFRNLYIFWIGNYWWIGFSRNNIWIGIWWEIFGFRFRFLVRGDCVTVNLGFWLVLVFNSDDLRFACYIFLCMNFYFFHWGFWGIQNVGLTFLRYFPDIDQIRFWFWFLKGLFRWWEWDRVNNSDFSMSTKMCLQQHPLAWWI